MIQNFPIPKSRRHLEASQPTPQFPTTTLTMAKKGTHPPSQLCKTFTYPSSLLRAPSAAPAIPERVPNSTDHFNQDERTQLTPTPSQIPHDRRAPHLHGHDGLLQDVHAAARASPAEHAEIRSSRYVCNSMRLWGGEVRTVRTFADDGVIVRKQVLFLEQKRKK